MYMRSASSFDRMTTYACSNLHIIARALKFSPACMLASSIICHPSILAAKPTSQVPGFVAFLEDSRQL